MALEQISHCASVHRVVKTILAASAAACEQRAEPFRQQRAESRVASFCISSYAVTRASSISHISVSRRQKALAGVPGVSSGDCVENYARLNFRTFAGGGITMSIICCASCFSAWAFSSHVLVTIIDTFDATNGVAHDALGDVGPNALHGTSAEWAVLRRSCSTQPVTPELRSSLRLYLARPPSCWPPLLGKDKAWTSDAPADDAHCDIGQDAEARRRSPFRAPRFG